jgi:hypothetical protein
MAPRPRAPKGTSALDPIRRTRAVNINNADPDNFVFPDHTKEWARGTMQVRPQSPQPHPAVNALTLLTLPGEVLDAISSFMDQNTTGALRQTCWRFRNNIARVRCWNTPRWAFTGTSSCIYLGLSVANPWNESIAPTRVKPRCQIVGSFWQWPRREIRHCDGHIVLPAARQPRHGPDFWVCRSCALDIYTDYDHTGYPPWFHALCRPCSLAERARNPRICTCHVDYGLANYWLCSDCRQQFGEMQYECILKTANTLPIRDQSITNMRDITRWIRHGDSNRHFCRCGKSWTDTCRTYPLRVLALPGIQGGRDYTDMFQQCLVCQGDCQTNAITGLPP